MFRTRKKTKNLQINVNNQESEICYSCFQETKPTPSPLALLAATCSRIGPPSASETPPTATMSNMQTTANQQQAQQQSKAATDSQAQVYF